jgi:hypothetical protein
MSNGRMTNELHIGKDTKGSSHSLLRDIFIKFTRMKNLSQDSQCPGQYSLMAWYNNVVPEVYVAETKIQVFQN